VHRARVLSPLAVAAVLAACTPGLYPGATGYTAARVPRYGSITIAPQPGGLGPVNGGAAFWNAAAGRALFTVTTNNPTIRFQPGGPFITPPQHGSRRVIAYASTSRNPCIVHFDPSYVAAGVPGRHLNARLWAHEIGHCLDLDSHRLNVMPCPSTAVMSDCNFWARVLAGWGPTADDTNQLRAAGYIP
jgi:hypothetical protein